MTMRVLVISGFLAMAATVPAFAAEDRISAKLVGASKALSAAAEPTPPLKGPKTEGVPLAEPYAILNSISIFAQDHRGGEKQPARTPGRIVRSVPQMPVFRGAMIDDAGPLALMEIPDGKVGKTTVYLREGQTVPWGDSKVVSITLDMLRLSRKPMYSWQNDWIDIPLGCNLNGQQIGTLPLAPGSGTWKTPGRGDWLMSWTSGPRPENLKSYEQIKLTE